MKVEYIKGIKFVTCDNLREIFKNLNDIGFPKKNILKKENYINFDPTTFVMTNEVDPTGLNVGEVGFKSTRDKQSEQRNNNFSSKINLDELEKELTATPSTSSNKEGETKEIIKVNRWNIVELKFANLKYKQNNIHTDVKLILGYLACLVACFCGYYGHVTPDIIFIGDSTNGDDQQQQHTLIIHTNAKRYSNLYSIIFELKNKNESLLSLSSTDKGSEYKISKSYGSWFDVNGVLDIKRFENDLTEGLGVVVSGNNKPHTQ
ncbi:7465_t:CDS:2 [Entrophospora sp. SA101]|nr:7465_t:CDS:2 [Entrophospora sp. SA101]